MIERKVLKEMFKEAKKEVFGDTKKGVKDEIVGIHSRFG